MRILRTGDAGVGGLDDALGVAVALFVFHASYEWWSGAVGNTWARDVGVGVVPIVWVQGSSKLSYMINRSSMGKQRKGLGWSDVSMIVRFFFPLRSVNLQICAPSFNWIGNYFMERYTQKEKKGKGKGQRRQWNMTRDAKIAMSLTDFPWALTFRFHS